MIAMWSADFRALGQRFAPPGLVPYYGGVYTGCGVMRSRNAIYCPADNTIYFDEVFVAAQAKRAAAQLGTDGDMAAIGVIAHEMGHAVAMQLGHISHVTYQNEATADCLAGVDGWILTRAAALGHGTREQRMQNFKSGLDGGAGACLPEFRGIQ